MKHKIIKNKSGFTLLETLVAITILIFVITGPLELTARSIGAAIISQNQITALYLAQEGVEVVRNIRDTNLLSGNDWMQDLDNCISANGCYIDVIGGKNISACPGDCPNIKYESGVGYNYISGNNTPFVRKIEIELNPGGLNIDEAKLEITVEWREKFGVKNFVLEEYIYKQ